MLRGQDTALLVVYSILRYSRNMLCLNDHAMARRSIERDGLYCHDLFEKDAGMSPSHAFNGDNRDTTMTSIAFVIC